MRRAASIADSFVGREQGHRESSSRDMAKELILVEGKVEEIS